MRRASIIISFVAAFAVMFSGVAPASAAKYRAPSGLQAHVVKVPKTLMVWKKVKGGQEYKIAISKRSDMKGAKTYKTSGSTPKKYVKSLRNSTRYYVKVRSLSKKGRARSPWSRSYTFVTPSRNKPAAPTGLRATERKAGSITMFWDRVPSAVSYRVYYQTGSQQKVLVTEDVNSARISGLSKSTAYSISVASVNNFDTVSPLSAPVQVSTRAYDLVAPADVKVTSRTSTTIDMSWSQVANAARYRVIYSSDSSPAQFIDQNATTVSLRGLTPGKNYSVTVVAMDNDDQRSPYSKAVETSTLAYDLAQPSRPLMASRTATSMTMYWDAVPNATGYRFYFRSGEVWTPVDVGNTTSYALGGMTPNTGYAFKVAAMDANQISPDSIATGAATYAYDLQAPTGLDNSSKTTSSITLRWNTAAHATQYRIYYRVGGTDTWGSRTFSARNTYTFSNLDRNRTHFYYMVAMDGEQTSATTPQISVKTEN